MELKTVRLVIPENGNIIVGQSHFIKTVEDLYEAIVNTVPQMKFGIAFNEASGACLIRVDGNDTELEGIATENAQAIAAGHTFVIAMRDGYPDQHAGSHPRDSGSLQHLLRHRESGRSDRGGDANRGAESWASSTAASPKGIESANDREWRHGLLRKIGYKR